MDGASQVQGGKQDPLFFTKMAGGGNDFVVIDDRSGAVIDPAGLARRICTRRLSVGADGLILIQTSSRASFRMRYFNADGSLGEFCGNGTRCAARFALMGGVAAPRMTIETDAGVVTADVDGERVRISLPPPQGFRADRPLVAAGSTVRGSSVTVGVPHYVTFVEAGLWEMDIDTPGRAIRHHADMQPAGTNVDFVAVRDSHAIDVRTWERGVEAETLSCGSGVVASVAVATLLGKVRPPVAVLTRSGITLEVDMVLQEGELRGVRLTGDARVIYRASVTPETLAGFDPDFVRNPAGAELRESSR